MIPSLLLGALGWTLAEYAIHRWLGHDRRYVRNAFGTEHTRHHAVASYFGPAWKKALAAVGVVGGLGVPAVAVGGAVALAGVLGFVGAYLTYEVIHRLLHAWEGVGPYGRWARVHHFHHHFEDPQSNFGVTTPVWDVVFGTYRAPATIRVPRKLAMGWLLDPSTGDVRAHLAHRYALRGRVGTA